MKLALVARFGRRAEMKSAAGVLAAAGHEVTSLWPWADPMAGVEAIGVPRSVDISQERARVAALNLEQIWQSEVALVFTEPDPALGQAGAHWSPLVPGSAARGGRHVEYGYALALAELGVLRAVVVVGPAEHQFYSLADVGLSPVVRRVADLPAALVMLEAIAILRPPINPLAAGAGVPGWL
jgi:hypothetical protein